jgi:ribose transport system substrate-binding protein
VENFLRQKVDLLIISPNEATPLTPVVKRAFDAGIPVIVLDREIEGDTYTTFIGADNRVIGKAAGEYVAQVLRGKGNVVEIKGLPGSTPARDRSEGFREAIAAFPGIRVIHDPVANWLREEAMTQMEAALSAHQKIDLVYAHNDPMAMGAYLAARAKGRDSTITFVGIDGLPGLDGGRQAVKDGKLAATFVYPTGGKEAVDIAVKILRHETVPHRITLGTERITKGS